MITIQLILLFSPILCFTAEEAFEVLHNNHHQLLLSYKILYDYETFQEIPSTADVSQPNQNI